VHNVPNRVKRASGVTIYEVRESRSRYFCVDCS